VLPESTNQVLPCWDILTNESAQPGGKTCAALGRLEVKKKEQVAIILRVIMTGRKKKNNNTLK